MAHDPYEDHLSHEATILLDEIRRLHKRLDTLHEEQEVRAVREALGDDQLIHYGTFLRAQGISYDLGRKLRANGKLKAVEVGGKLMVRAGEARKFVRTLKLAK